MNNFEKICDLIYEEIDKRFKSEPLNVDNLEFSDSAGDLIEKIISATLRMWKLEDACAIAQTDSEIADLKRKIDFIFKKKRPQLIRCLNLMLDKYIAENKPFGEPNIKEYAGFKQ